MLRQKLYLFGFLGLIAFDTFSQICFKMAAIKAEPFLIQVEWLIRVLETSWVYGAVTGYLGAFLIWMTLLRYAPIGPAFAASHLEVIGVMAVSAPLFGEALSMSQILGAMLVVAGVLCLARDEAQSNVHLKLNR
jgi:drug/metabolite transporter (DMT)-like permease